MGQWNGNKELFNLGLILYHLHRSEVFIFIGSFIFPVHVYI